MPEFKIVSKFKPTGDQPKAINSLVESINREIGGSSSGVTDLVKHIPWLIIERVQKPTLILAHNKTLQSTVMFRI